MREALGQILATERQQWRRERELIQSEAQRVIADLRAANAELTNELRQKVAEAKPVVGPPGPQGERGLPGRLPIAKAFESGKVFYEGDCVTLNCSTYQALRDTGQRPGSSSDWACLARAGRDGTDGITPTVRGTYDAYEKYNKLDIVASGGAAFIAKHDNPGVCPGDGWQMISRQGGPGRKGETGERGLRGEKGEKGPPAVVPQFMGAKIDENYNLIRVLSDGTEEVMSLYPAFEHFLKDVGGINT